MSHAYTERSLAVDLSRAIELCEAALEAGHDNRYGWDPDSDNFIHYEWLKSRLRQARLEQHRQANGTVAGRGSRRRHEPKSRTRTCKRTRR